MFFPSLPVSFVVMLVIFSPQEVRPIGHWSSINDLFRPQKSVVTKLINSRDIAIHRVINYVDVKANE